MQEWGSEAGRGGAATECEARVGRRGARRGDFWRPNASQFQNAGRRMQTLSQIVREDYEELPSCKVSGDVHRCTVA